MPVLRRWVAMHQRDPGDGRWGIPGEDFPKAPTRLEMDQEYARYAADVNKQIAELESELSEAPGDITSV